jgi:hypothetical protein
MAAWVHYSLPSEGALVRHSPTTAPYLGVLRSPGRPADGPGMTCRVDPKYKTGYRVTNWAEYGQVLAQRGEITLWISPGTIQAWTANPSGRRGAPQRYTDLVIETALTLRVLLRLMLRQTEGFLRSLLDLMDLSLEAPDHTPVSRRGGGLRLDLGLVTSKKPVHLINDSTGLSIVGEGEWAAGKHGERGKRGRRG